MGRSHDLAIGDDRNVPFQGARVQRCGLAVLRGPVPKNNAPNETPLCGISQQSCSRVAHFHGTGVSCDGFATVTLYPLPIPYPLVTVCSINQRNCQRFTHNSRIISTHKTETTCPMRPNSDSFCVLLKKSEMCEKLWQKGKADLSGCNVLCLFEKVIAFIF